MLLFTITTHVFSAFVVRSHCTICHYHTWFQYRSNGYKRFASTHHTIRCKSLGPNSQGRFQSSDAIGSLNGGFTIIKSALNQGIYLANNESPKRTSKTNRAKPSSFTQTQSKFIITFLSVNSKCSFYRP
jgi:hypothetical protein